MDRQGKFVGGFTAQKLLQVPAGFGTGCIVQLSHEPELLASTIRLLESIQYTGIAEVEYKWDERQRRYQLIEINPRPWDQHILGESAGCDLMHLAYCDHAGVSRPPAIQMFSAALPQTWVAEDALLFELLRLLWRRDPSVRQLGRLLTGRRVYAIWNAADPLPWFKYVFRQAIPWFATQAVSRLWLAGKEALAKRVPITKERSV
jgi:predicted ATP-grasp superfamily ATP-dependent carboligase